MTGIELETFANSLGSGFVKPWKANGIVITLKDIPDITGERLIKYIRNCLEMEAFSTAHCIKIAKWIEAQKEEI